jgi:hypothetical protein
MNRKPYNGVLLDVAAAATLLGTTERAIRARVSRRLLPYRKFSGRVVFVRSELEQFIAALPGVTLEEARLNLMMRAGETVCR